MSACSSSYRFCGEKSVQHACSGPPAFPNNSITMSLKACETWTISLLHCGTVISLMIWVGWESWKEIWVCVNFLLSMSKDEPWNNKHADTIWPKGFFGVGATQKRTERRGQVSISGTDLELSTQMNPPVTLLPLSSLLTVRVLLGKHSQAGRALMMRHAEVVLALVALCPLIACCADRKCQEMETASGWLFWLKLLRHISYTSSDDGRIDKTLISLSDWALKNSMEGLNLLPFPYCSLPSCFSLKGKRFVLRDHSDCLQCWNNITLGILWLPCVLLCFISL